MKTLQSLEFTIARTKLIAVQRGHIKKLGNLVLLSMVEAVTRGLLTDKKGLSPSLVAHDVSRVGLLNCTGRGNINSSYNNRIASEQESR